MPAEEVAALLRESEGHPMRLTGTRCSLLPRGMHGRVAGRSCCPAWLGNTCVAALNMTTRCTTHSTSPPRADIALSADVRFYLRRWEGAYSLEWQGGDTAVVRFEREQDLKGACH